jgi:hypothetical protein
VSDGPTGSDSAPIPAQVPEPRREDKGPGGYGWVGGVVLIALGVVFMAQQSGYMIGNWWAVFIYIAAFANFGNMIRSWRKEGRFSPAATGSLVGGLLLTTIASIFVFNLRWDIWWPSVLIAIGLGIVLGSLLGRR